MTMKNYLSVCLFVCLFFCLHFCVTELTVMSALIGTEIKVEMNHFIIITLLEIILLCQSAEEASVG